MSRDKERDGIVDVGPSRIRHEEIARIRSEVLARFAADLAEAGFFRRLLLSFRIRREIERELDKVAPSRGLYARR